MIDPRSMTEPVHPPYASGSAPGRFAAEAWQATRPKLAAWHASFNARPSVARMRSAMRDGSGAGATCTAGAGGAERGGGGGRCGDPVAGLRRSV